MRIRLSKLAIALGFAALFALGIELRSATIDDKPFPTAFFKPNAPTAAATLTFSIQDEHGASIPGRLTFLDPTGFEPTIFVDSDPAPGILALRRNIVYGLGPRATITVPPGKYQVFASHGIEWSLDKKEMTLEAGKSYAWDAKLVHELDTTGWVAGDFHLHTYTYSGHGDANMNERLISLVGEGVEFAVATDHNHYTDYVPTMKSLGVQNSITSIVGDEVSTSIGHFNAFPLDATRAVIDSSTTDAHVLFNLIRRETNTFGVKPLIQVNHPRYEGIDYFAIKHLDCVTGECTDPSYADDFDSVEILNANPNWGIDEPYDANVPPQVNLHSVLFDWFHLLNRGARYTAVGNSDSHTVHYDMAGYPRNFVHASDDSVGRINTSAVVAAVRAKDCFTTNGPWLEFKVNGASMGQSLNLRPGAPAAVSIRVRSASWIGFDRVKLIVNGDVAKTFEVAKGERSIDASTNVDLDHDAWMSAIVEGDGTLAPIVIDAGRPVHPIAIGNPVWVHIGTEGKWTSPWERAKSIVASGAAETNAAWTKGAISERCMVLTALAETKPDVALGLCGDALADPARSMRLTAARVAEKLCQASLRPALDLAAKNAGKDDYFALAVLRARIRCGEDATALFVEFEQEHRGLPTRHLKLELEPLLPRTIVSEWMAIGYFAAPTDEPLANSVGGPERDADTTHAWPDKNEHDARWRIVHAAANGLVSLVGLDGDRAHDNAPQSISYAQSWLWSDADKVVVCALGSDDGARVWIDDARIWDEPANSEANPWGAVLRVSLKRGWNRVLFKVHNDKGFTGFYFRVFDASLKSALKPDDAR